VNEGRVKGVIIEDVGHLIPMEKVGDTAESTAQWVGGEMDRWRAAEKLAEDDWEGRKGVERAQLSERYLELMGATPGMERKGKIPAEKL